jgi:hypothetical protein
MHYMGLSGTISYGGSYYHYAAIIASIFLSKMLTDCLKHSLNHPSSCLPKRGAGSAQAMVGAAVPVDRVCEGGQAEPAVPSCFPEARTLAALLSHFGLVYLRTLLGHPGFRFSAGEEISCCLCEV